MEAAAAGLTPVCNRLDIAAASIAFGSLEPHNADFASEAALLAAQRDESQLREGGAAAGWTRRLEHLCRRERLRMYTASLDNCFLPLQEQLRILAAGAAGVSATCQAAAQQLKQTLVQRQPVLDALQLLRDRRLLLQERQRLRGLLFEQLRLSSPLLQVIAAGGEAYESADHSSREARLPVCDRFFDALEELQRIREHASFLQRVVAPPDFACAASASAGNNDDGMTDSGASAASANFYNSLLRRRALAETVLQQAGELEELAYERLYLWLQQECRTASAAAAAESDAAEEVQAGTANLHKPETPRIDSGSTVRDSAIAAEATRFPALFAALAAVGVTAALPGSQDSASSGRAATTAKTPRRDGLRFASAENRENAFSATAGSEGTTSPPRSEELRSNEVEIRATPTERRPTIFLQCCHRLRQPVPLLLRACVTLQQRPAYLYHCLQELLRVRQKDVTEQFYRVLSASSSVFPRRIWVCSSSSSSDVAAVTACGNEDVESAFSGDRGAGAPVSNVCSSRRLVYSKRSQPLTFLQGLLQCLTGVAVRERAVVSGLQQLLLPVRCEADAAARSEGARAAAAITLAATLPDKAATANQGDLRSVALTTEKLQLIDGVDALLERQGKREDSQDDAAADIFCEYSGMDSMEAKTVAHDAKAAENNYGFVISPVSAAASQTNASTPAAGGETEKADSSAVETMCRTDILEFLLSGVAQIFEQQLEEVLAAVQQQQELRGRTGGEQRHKQRPACTLSALAMAHLLDKHAILLRRLLLFDIGANEQQHQRMNAEAGGSGGTLALAHEAAATGTPTNPAGDAERTQCLSTINFPDTMSFVSGRKRAAGDYRGLPKLITCCERFAEKAELLFLSLWELQIIYAASSPAGGLSADLLVSASCTRDSAIGSSEPSDLHVHSETVSKAFADVGAEGRDSLLLEVMSCLQQALEVLHAPLNDGVEDEEASAALVSFIETALDDSRGAAQETVGDSSEGKAPESCVRHSEVRALSREVPTEAVGEETGAGGIVAMSEPRPLMESIVYFFKQGSAVCHRTPARRSKITGLRITERLGPLQENESEELDAWVESSVAPLLNFCRQETRRFSDAGDAAVFLINAYSSIEAPLRRFAVCRVYAQLLEELIEQQLAVLHQVETRSLFSRLELHETLDAVRREVHRRKVQDIQDTAVGEERDQERIFSGTRGLDALNGKFHVNALQKDRTVQWRESRPDSWEANDRVQVGGALSPAELCLQEAALSSFFKKFSSVLYALQSVELQYVRRIVQAKRRREAGRLVMKEVVAAYAEIYVRTKHLGVAVHTPGEVALLVAS